MKRSLNILFVIICLLLPLTVFAMDHGKMSMGGEELPLGEVVVDGVKGTATLLDVSEAMAKHGMKTTHHLMVKFTNAETGALISKGRAAAKVQKAEGKESKAFKMMQMEGSFGTDLTLDPQGSYQFRVGTKLMDKKKRNFTFEFGR